MTSLGTTPAFAAEMASLHALWGGNVRIAQEVARTLPFVPPTAVEEEVVFHVLDRCTSSYRSLYDPRRLPRSQISALDALALAPKPMRPSDIAERTGDAPNALNVTLSRLLGEGLVSKRKAPEGIAVYYEVADPLLRLWRLFRCGDPALENVLSVRRFVRDWRLGELKDQGHRAFDAFLKALEDKSGPDPAEEPFEVRRAIGFMLEDTPTALFARFLGLWDFYDAETPLRETALKLLAIFATDTRKTMDYVYPELEILLDGDWKKFNNDLFRGWYRSLEFSRYNAPALAKVMREPGYRSNKILRALVLWHGTLAGAKRYRPIPDALQELHQEILKEDR